MHSGEEAACVDQEDIGDGDEAVTSPIGETGQLGFSVTVSVVGDTGGGGWWSSWFVTYRPYFSKFPPPLVSVKGIEDLGCLRSDPYSLRIG